MPAYLPDHEVVFDYLSSSRKGGVLDLRPSVGKIVPGALFEVTEEDLRTLDLKEGVPLIYRRVEKKVLLADGREVMARAYEVAPGYRLPPPVAPAEAYVRIVAEGLAAFGHDDRMLQAAAKGEPAPFLATGLFVYGTLLRGGSRHREFERCGGAAASSGHGRGSAPRLRLLPGDARRHGGGPFTANWSNCATSPWR